MSQYKVSNNYISQKKLQVLDKIITFALKKHRECVKIYRLNHHYNVKKK